MIRQHADWLNAMNVDFILVDWSNNLMSPLGDPGTISRTDALFDTYAGMTKHPKIAIVLGALRGQADIDSGGLQRQIEAIKSHY